MEYREYGKTGKRISVLGCGGSRFPDDMTNTPEGRERCAEIILKTAECGVNFFDTGFDYCNGHCEEIFGLAFSRMKGEFHVSAKSRLNTDPDADAVRRRIERSLKIMNLEKISFYHMWCIYDLDHYRQVMRPGGPYEGAVKAKEAGLIDHICFSTHCSGEETEIIVNEGAFEGMIIGYNLINHSYRKRGVEAAAKKGMGIVIMNTLAGGVLPQNADYFSSYCKEGESITDAAFRFVLSEPGVTCAMSGMITEQEVFDNVRSVEKIDYSAEKACSTADTVKAPAFDDLCTGCGYCKGCPKGIEINKLMLGYNQSIFKGDMDATMEALQTWWEYGKTKEYPCIKCGACERKCTQHLPIIDRIARINEITLPLRKKALDNLKSLYSESDVLGIYAIGGLSKRFMEEMKDCGYHPQNTLMFDSSEAKWGREIIQGYTVNPPDRIISSGITKLIVTILSDETFQKIKASLSDVEKAGIPILKYNPVV